MQDEIKESVKEAVIVGGGLIGIETCEALQLAGKKVNVVERLPQILPFLDWEMAKIAEKEVRKKGANIITNTSVEEFIGANGKITGVKLSDGRVINCDVAVIAIGNKPNIVVIAVKNDEKGYVTS